MLLILRLCSARGMSKAIVHSTTSDSSPELVPRATSPCVQRVRAWTLSLSSDVIYLITSLHNFLGHIYFRFDITPI